MIGALLQGQLATDPVERETKNGQRFVTANMRVAAGAETLFVGIAAFGDTAAERLAGLKKGGTLAAAGTLEAVAWTGKDGGERTGWRLTATEVLTIYQAHRRREPAASSDEGAA